MPSALWLRRIGELVARSVPNCETLAVSRSRHFPHFENPVEFNPNVLKFISKRT